MNNSSGLFQTSVGRKILMGLTGLFLITFLVVHVTLNSLIFWNDEGMTFNAGAHFMSHNPIVQFLEVGLFAFLIAHIVLSLILTIQNRRARPVGYHTTNANANSAWYSRSMGVLGSLLLIFLVVHLSNFWIPTKVSVYRHEEHDTYMGLREVFSRWYFVIIYLVGVAGLLFHLLHGFQSAFQSLGLNHHKYTPFIKRLGIWFSVVVCGLFAAMPISMFFKIIQ